jgi:intein/homing endonuclease
MWVRNDGFLIIECDYEQRNLVKEIGGRWDVVERAWVVAFSISNVEYLVDEIDSLTVDQSVEDKLHQQIEKEDKLNKIREMSKQDVPVRLLVPGLKENCRLYNYQKLGVVYSLTNAEGVLIADEMGLGKFCAINTPVLTAYGWQPIGSLKVGDMVYSRAGTLSRVNGVYPQGVKELLKVTFSDGFSCECGWEHLWIAQTDNNAKRKQGWRVLDTRQLFGDLHYKDKRAKWRIPLVEPIAYNTKTYIIPPYLMGVLLGDGSLTDGVTFVPGDDETPFLVQKAVPPGYSLHKNADYGTSTRYSIVYKGSGYENPLKTQIVKYGLNVTGERKFIPHEYLEGSIEQRKQLLAGLLDTDGSAMKARTRFSTVSERLADDVIELVHSLGGMATKSLVPGRLRVRDGKQVQEQDCWQLVVRTSFNPFSRPSSIAKWKRSSKLVRNIVSIEPVRYDDAVCIAVDSKDHSYVIQHHIVTHNTLQGLAISLVRKNKNGAKKCLIVTPASLKYNWPIEIEKFTDEKFVVIDGSPEERIAQWMRDDVYYYVVNFELILEDLFGGREYKEDPDDDEEKTARKKELKAKAQFRKKILSSVKERDWDMILVDESHALKSHASKRSKCIKQLKSKFRVALTGTPMDGRLEELHSVMEFVYPGLLESRTRFLQKHAITDFWGKVTGYKDIDDVKKRIAHCFIRRLKADVLKDLPNKIYQNRIVVLSKEEEKIYKALASSGHVATQDTEAMVTVIRCKQFCDYPGLIGENCKVNSKLEAFKEILDEVIIQNGHKVLVFSQYKQMIDVLVKVMEEMNLKYLRIDGDTPKQLRAGMQKQFNEDKSIDSMIGTEAMSTGLNFTSADYVINYDDNWAPAIMAQREDRCVIEGQYVNTDRGMVKIEDVKTGDMVLTHRGRYRKVLDVWNKLHRSNTTGGLTTEIKYRRYGYPLKVTHDHLVLILRGEKIDWMEAVDVRPRDFLLSPILSEERNDPGELEFPEEFSFNKMQRLNGSAEFVNGRYHPLPRAIKIDDDFLFVVGWYLAEGFCSISNDKGKFVSFSGHVKEMSILERIKKYSKEILGINGTINKPATNGIELRVYSSELAFWFESLFGGECFKKQIPHDWLVKWDIKYLEKIYGAYVQGDGYFRRNTKEWVTVSPILSLQMTKITEMMGYPSTLRQVDNCHNKGHWIGALTANGDYRSSPLLNKKVDGYVCLPVSEVMTRIETSKKVRVYDLTVEEDSSFVVGRAAVHNCHRLGQKNVVNVINFVCKNTIEERIRGVLYGKSVVSAETLGDDVDDMVLHRLGPKDIAKLL